MKPQAVEHHDDVVFLNDSKQHEANFFFLGLALHYVYSVRKCCQKRCFFEVGTETVGFNRVFVKEALHLKQQKARCVNHKPNLIYLCLFSHLFTKTVAHKKNALQRGDQFVRNTRTYKFQHLYLRRESCDFSRVTHVFQN